MIIGRAARSGLCVLCFVVVGQPSAADSTPANALERIREAASEFPEDPDLAWAYARHLAAQKDVGAAIDELNRFMSRWPERHPDARLEIAQDFIEAGEDAAAIMLLDEQIGANPRSGTARFYRGLALRGRHRIEEAIRDFEAAGRLLPILQPEALLARALGRFEMGQEEKAVDLLKTILALDPTGDAAVRARLLLRRREVFDLERSWQVEAYAGFEWDDNVTLESGVNEVLPSNQEDFRGLWGLAASARTWATERVSLSLGFRHDQTKHDKLGQFDLISDSLFGSITMRSSGWLSGRLDVVAYNTLQDLDAEATGGLIRPNLIIAFRQRWGVLRTFAQFEGTEYHDHTTFAPLERDAISYSFGFQHFLPLRRRDSWSAVSVSWARTLTQARPGGGPDGFDGDFDYDSWRVRANTRLALPWQIQGQLDVSYAHDDYRNDNLLHAIETLGEIRKRRDDTLIGRIGISRPILNHVKVEVYYRGTRRFSNIDLFDYDKHLVGVLLRFSTN